MDKGQIMQLVQNSKASSHLFEKKNLVENTPKILNDAFLRELAQKSMVSLMQQDPNIYSQLYFLNLQKQKELVTLHNSYKQHLLPK